MAVCAHHFAFGHLCFDAFPGIRLHQSNIVMFGASLRDMVKMKSLWVCIVSAIHTPSRHLEGIDAI